MEQYKQQFKNNADKAVSYLETQLSKLHATGAHPNLVGHIEVDYHGEKTPLSNISTIRAQDALSMIVVPFEQDKKVCKDIAAAISAFADGLTVTDEGKQVRIGVPPVTEEKRVAFVKEAKEITEKAKISIRNIRQDVLKKIKGDESLSDDLKKDAENAIQELVNEYNNKIEEHFKNKETELMTV